MENQNIINDIRNKIDIVDLVNEYVPLTKKGQSFWGVCPFHPDKNPSMSVDSKRQIFTCWSCHKTGNVFTFLQEIENINFYEALKLLGEKVGVTVGNSSPSYNKKYNKFYEVYDLTEKYYQLMISTDSGKKAKEYLKERKINEDTIKGFGIGVALNEKDKLWKYLKTKNYDINTLNDIGLLNGDYDTFINRIVFPLKDRNGRTVAFSGRIYDSKDKSSKYINTKETAIFKKGHCLYNYYNCKDYVRSSKFVIVMEGFMDVIRASTIGIKNTVALMGTALSEEQILLLKKLSLNVYLCLDGDNPGIEATKHNAELLEHAGFNVKIITLNDDDDPDTFILKYGTERFSSVVENALNYKDYKIERLRDGVNFTSELELSNYIKRVIEETVRIDDEIRREIILKKLANETNVSYNTLEKKLNEYFKNANNERVELESFANKVKYDKYHKASLEFIYYMLVNPSVIKVYDKEKLHFLDSNMRSLAAEISYYYHNFGDIVIADFYTYLNDKEELLKVLNSILSLQLEDNISEIATREYAFVINNYNVRLEIKRLNDLIKNEIDELEKAKIAEKIRLLRIEE